MLWCCSERPLFACLCACACCSRLSARAYLGAVTLKPRSSLLVFPGSALAICPSISRSTVFANCRTCCPYILDLLAISLGRTARAACLRSSLPSSLPPLPASWVVSTALISFQSMTASPSTTRPYLLMSTLQSARTSSRPMLHIRLAPATLKS